MYSLGGLLLAKSTPSHSRSKSKATAVISAINLLNLKINRSLCHRKLQLKVKKNCWKLMPSSLSVSKLTEEIVGGGGRNT